MWTTLEEFSLETALSGKELESYLSGIPTEDREPVRVVLDRVADLVRGYVRSNPRVKMGAVPHTLPPSLHAPAFDYAIFDILKRVPGSISEPRRLARDQAVELFKAIAAGEITPESDVQDDATDTATAPAMAPLAASRPRRYLDRIQYAPTETATNTATEQSGSIDLRDKATGRTVRLSAENGLLTTEEVHDES